MKERSSCRVALCCLAAFAVAGAAAFAQEATPAPDKYLELLRSDLRTGRVEVLTEALDLTDVHAAAFWPIYRQYETELEALGDRRVALVKNFAAKFGTMTDTDAATIAKDWFSIQKERTKLREKYHEKVAKATSELIAARFIQVENTIGMLIDLQIAAELPLME
jgi:hypothetical protein